MVLGIQAHVVGLSLSNTVDLLDSLSVQRSRKAIHGWVQKVDLQLKSGISPNQIALHKTVIRINGQEWWPYAVTRNRRRLVDEQAFFLPTLVPLQK